MKLPDFPGTDQQLRIIAGVSVSVPFLAYLINRTLRRKKIVNISNKLVIVTGCDSGIGLDLALRMLDEGFVVIATVVNPDSAGAVAIRSKGESALVRVLQYPKYQQINSIQKLVDELRDIGTSLHCLVNNAAVMVYGKTCWYTPDMIENQVNVNFTGTMLLTKAMLSRLDSDGGRIVNISSTMGILASPMLSVYCATKAGLEAFSRSLRRENVTVVVVRPNNLPLQTGIMARSRDNLRIMRKALEPSLRTTSGREIEYAIRDLDQLYEDHKPSDDDHTISDKRLIRCLRDSILLKYPARTYSAAPWYAKLLLSSSQYLPDSIMDWVHRSRIPNILLHLSRV